MLDLAAIVRATPMGDARRNERALALVTAMVQGQAAATHGAAGAATDADGGTPWAHAMGAFRFYDNDDLDRPTLAAPVRTALGMLVPLEGVAYVIHDLSPLDYSHHTAKRDRIRVGNDHGLGYELYGALVLDTAGRPLGPAFHALHTAAGVLTSTDAAPVPFVDHFDLVRRGVAATRAALPGRSLVHVYDREFDDIGLLRDHRAAGEHVVVRVQHLQRQVRWQGETVALAAGAAVLDLQHAAQVEHQGETYELYVAATAVTLVGPSWRGRHRGQAPTPGAPLTLRLVVTELRHPQRTRRWVLLTDLEVDPRAVAQIYVWRWTVERYFYLEKVGLRLERWTQTTGERIARRLALASLAAMVLYQLHANLHRVECREVLAWVARAGGWLGRANDALGPTVLMRGLFAIIHALALVECYGSEELQRRAHALADVVGLPIPGTPRAQRSARKRRAAHATLQSAGQDDV